MPKPLTRPQISSSVASMLEPSAAMQVLARPALHSGPLSPVPMQHQSATDRHTVEKASLNAEVPSIPRQFTLTPSADKTLKRLVTVYSEATGIDLKHSELLRAILIAIDHAMPVLARQAAQIGRLRRPKNERGREAEREMLERQIAKAFIAATRLCGSLH